MATDLLSTATSNENHLQDLLHNVNQQHARVQQKVRHVGEGGEQARSADRHAKAPINQHNT